MSISEFETSAQSEPRSNLAVGADEDPRHNILSLLGRAGRAFAAQRQIVRRLGHPG